MFFAPILSSEKRHFRIPIEQISYVSGRLNSNFVWTQRKKYLKRLGFFICLDMHKRTYTSYDKHLIHPYSSGVVVCPQTPTIYRRDWNSHRRVKYGIIFLAGNEQMRRNIYSREDMSARIWKLTLLQNHSVYMFFKVTILFRNDLSGLLVKFRARTIIFIYLILVTW